MIGKKFTIKPQPTQVFDPGEVYEMQFTPAGKKQLTVKAKCLEYMADSDQYRFEVVEAEKQ